MFLPNSALLIDAQNVINVVMIGSPKLLVSKLDSFKHSVIDRDEWKRRGGSILVGSLLKAEGK